MSFIMVKKKKYKFQVDFLLESLTSVPFVNGILFAKIRLNDIRKFSDNSQRVEVEDHCVKWGKKFNFTFKTCANICTGILEPVPCRISIRKEIKGGKSFLKVGYVDVDLCEFAGGGETTHRYLLEGYDAKHRQDNSILCITLSVNLVAGDPCFKVPTSTQTSLLPEATITSAATEDYLSTGSLASRSSGFGSLPRHPLVPPGAEDNSWKDEGPPALKPPLPDFELSHSRNSSYVSGYGSLQSHSRQSSSESGVARPANAASYIELGGGSLKERKRPLPKKQLTEESRVDSTRVNVDQLIDELLEGTNFETAESPGLQLIINKDGTAALSQ